MKLIERLAGAGRLLRSPLAGYPGARYFGTTAVENLKNAEVQADTLEKTAERFGFDLVLPFMDLSVEAEALGLDVQFHDDGAPDVRNHPVVEEADLKRMAARYAGCSGRMPLFAQVVSLLKARLTTPVGAYVSSPFTLAGLLMGAESLAIGILTEPEFCREVLEFSTQCVLDYALLQQEAGADTVVLLDPTAGLLSPGQYDEFVKPYVERISSALDIPTILHICGQTTPLVDRLAATNVDALSLDSAVALPAVMPHIDPSMVVMGNVDPVAMMQATPGEVWEWTEELITAMGSYPNFFLSTGCDLPLETPAENIEAFMSAGRR